jgi:hypothetical protein
MNLVLIALTKIISMDVLIALGIWIGGLDLILVG